VCVCVLRTVNVYHFILLKVYGNENTFPECLKRFEGKRGIESVKRKFTGKRKGCESENKKHS